MNDANGPEPNFVDHTSRWARQIIELMRQSKHRSQKSTWGNLSQTACDKSHMIRSGTQKRERTVEILEKAGIFRCAVPKITQADIPQFRDKNRTESSDSFRFSTLPKGLANFRVEMEKSTGLISSSNGCYFSRDVAASRRRLRAVSTRISPPPGLKAELVTT